MPVNLSIKNVPDDLAQRVRDRARRSRRSLQGELLVILEEAVSGRPPLDIHELRERVARLGLRTGDGATRQIRGERDAR